MDSKLAAILAELASQLNTTVEHLWQILLKQAVISGIVDILMLAAVGTLVYVNVMLWRFINTQCSKERGSWDVIAYAWPLVLSFITIICVFVSVSSLDTTLAAFINPDYWALHKILELLRK